MVSADLIVHVRDISHPDSEAQRADVEEVLKEIGAEEAPRIEAWNKIDLLGAEEAARVRAEAARREDVAVLSALDRGGGRRPARHACPSALRKENKERTVTVPASDGELIAWLHANGEVLSRDHEGLETRFVVRLSDKDWARFQAWRTARALDQLLGPLPERFELVDIHIFQWLVGQLFHLAEARFEAGGGFAQRGFRVRRRDGGHN